MNLINYLNIPGLTRNNENIYFFEGVEIYHVFISNLSGKESLELSFEAWDSATLKRLIKKFKFETFRSGTQSTTIKSYRMVTQSIRVIRDGNVVSEEDEYKFKLSLTAFNITEELKAKLLKEESA
tara:strand:+ start:47 stop:421 length:375 start_codon:yes stop_codon:yes gene_type:complete